MNPAAWMNVSDLDKFKDVVEVIPDVLLDDGDDDT